MTSDKQHIGLSPYVVGGLLEQERSGDLLALFTYYHFCATTQQTNKVKTPTAKTANALNWSVERTIRNKKILISLGLVKDVQIKHSLTNRVLSHFILLTTFHPTDFPEGGQGDYNGLLLISSNKIDQKILGRNSHLPESEDFENIIWPIWPRKLAKADAQKAWDKAIEKAGHGEFEMPPIEEIEAAVQGWKKSHDWTKQRGKFIPHCATWINGRRWEDELPDEVRVRMPKRLNRFEKRSLKKLNDVLEHCRGVEADDEEKAELLNVAYQIRDLHKTLPNNDIIRYHLSLPQVLIGLYCNWLKDNYKGLKDLTPKALGPESNGWKRFLRHESRSIGVSILTGKRMG